MRFVVGPQNYIARWEYSTETFVLPLSKRQVRRLVTTCTINLITKQGNSNWEEEVGTATVRCDSREPGCTPETNPIEMLVAKNGACLGVDLGKTVVNVLRGNRMALAKALKRSTLLRSDRLHAWLEWQNIFEPHLAKEPHKVNCKKGTMEAVTQAITAQPSPQEEQSPGIKRGPYPQPPLRHTKAGAVDSSVMAGHSQP